MRSVIDRHTQLATALESKLVSIIMDERNEMLSKIDRILKAHRLYSDIT